MKEILEASNELSGPISDYSEKIKKALGKLRVPSQAGDLRCGFRGRKRPYIALSDNEGVRWKLIAMFTHRQKIHGLKLYHRNSYGRRGFHSQHVRASGTKKGLRELLAYVAKHDLRAEKDCAKEQ